MTTPSDPDGLPKDPSDYRPRRILSPTFWAMIAFGVLCVLAGVAVATWAPKLMPKARPGAAVQATAAEQALVTVPPEPAPLALPAAAAADIGEVERLSARVAALETHEARVNAAAAAALAAAALMEVSQSSRPFSAELAALKAAAPGSPELAALTRLAETGAPSRAALAASFPDYAARAAVANRTPGEDAGLGQRIAYGLMRVVTVRRVGDVAGEGPDARLARAERLVEAGDIDAALRALDTLPPPAREAMAPWRTLAERRAEIDRVASILRGRALQTLTAAGLEGV